MDCILHPWFQTLLSWPVNTKSFLLVTPRCRTHVWELWAVQVKRDFTLTDHFTHTVKVSHDEYYSNCCVLEELLEVKENNKKLGYFLKLYLIYLTLPSLEVGVDVVRTLTYTVTTYANTTVNPSWNDSDLKGHQIIDRWTVRERLTEIKEEKKACVWKVTEWKERAGLHRWSDSEMLSRPWDTGFSFC